FSLRSNTNLGLVGVMLLTFFYYATYTVFGVMGDSGALWAPLAAWAPDLIYALGGVALLVIARRR
ncbi:MAG TPA: LptF/LptG family permease, partial [Deinococcales bacterium]|nr:LptF/LptG family permease [Deinococcales bacterium]